MSHSGSLRLLVVKLSAMGDVIHALPAVNRLRRLLPNAQIHWLIAQRWSSLLEGIDSVDKVIPLPKGIGGYLETIKALRLQKYHAVIDLQGLLKSAVLTFGSGSPLRVGFDTAFAREPVASFFYNKKVSPQGSHIVEQLMDVAEEASSLFTELGDGKDREVIWGLDPSELEREWARRALLDLGIEGPFVVLLPGTGWKTKTWHPEKFCELAKLIDSYLSIPSLVLWGPGEDDLVPQDDGIFVAPPTSLREMMAILSMASLVVGGDTGPLHMAVALGVPVVGLYGPTLPERNGPYSQDSQVVVKDCPHGGQHKRRCAEPCVESIPVEPVFEKVARLLR